MTETEDSCSRTCSQSGEKEDADYFCQLHLMEEAKPVTLTICKENLPMDLTVLCQIKQEWWHSVHLRFVETGPGQSYN